MSRHILSLCAAVGVLLATPAHARIIGVNIESSAPGDDLGVAETAGVVPSARWNNINVGAATSVHPVNVAATALNDNSGAATSATIAISSTDGYVGTSGAGSSTPDRKMMQSYLSWKASDNGVVTIANLPAAFTTGYSVYVYFDSDQNNRTFTITLNDGTSPSSIIGKDASTFAGVFQNAATSPNDANYAVFSGLTADGFTIQVASDTARAAINGIQIVSDDYQPPPTIESFTVTPGYVAPGSPVTFSWETTGATTVAIDQGVGDVTAESGSIDGTAPTSQAVTTYTLTATNEEGSATATVRLASGPPRPNILFFLVDDMGAADTSVPFLTDAAGNDVRTETNDIYRTPNMETLASRGMKFTRAYAMPVCTPTRVSLMNGLNSARHHVTNWTDVVPRDTNMNSTPSHKAPADWRVQGLDVTPTLLPKLLGNAGYRTIAAGKAHFGNIAGVNIDPRDIGFDVNIGGREIGRPGSYLGTANFGMNEPYHVPDLEQYHGQNIFLTEALTLEMNKEIEKSVDAGVPFFAYMSHYAVHDPYDADPRFTANYDGVLTGNLKSFATLLEGMDKSLGDIITKLTALGVAENTLVIFLSDNGSTLPHPKDPRRGYKGQKYEGGTRVPMIVAWAATNAANPHQATLEIPAASRTTDLVSITDTLPTILTAAGVAAPATPLDGTDLSPYLRGTSGHHRPQELMIHFPHDHNGQAGDYYTVLHQGDFKLIYTYPGKTYELFNLPIDPGEKNDIAASQPERVMAMARKMARELHEQTAQWPRFTSNLQPDPFLMPLLPGVDLDGDGIDDNNEDPNRNGLVDPGETDPDNPDSDGDGTQDGAEIRTGTDPLDGSSAFRATLTEELLLSWPSKPGANYRVEANENLASEWLVIDGDIPAAGSGSVTNYPLPATDGAPRMFYRAVLK